MAKTFLQQRKIQQTFIIVLVLVLLITVFVIWLGYRKQDAEQVQEPIFVPKKEISLNLNVLESALLEELKLFESIPAFEGELGRSNPFLSY